MRIGVPKEIKIQEYRVGVTPGAVRELVQHGHGVIVEHEAGVGIGYHDDAYRAAGAAIAPRRAESSTKNSRASLSMKRARSGC